jgi:hypothetical protein
MIKEIWHRKRYIALNDVRVIQYFHQLIFITHLIHGFLITGKSSLGDNLGNRQVRKEHSDINTLTARTAPLVRWVQRQA